MKAARFAEIAATPRLRFTSEMRNELVREIVRLHRMIEDAHRFRWFALGGGGYHAVCTGCTWQPAPPPAPHEIIQHGQHVHELLEATR